MQKPQIFTYQGKNVFGRNRFQPPFSMKQELLDVAFFVHVVKGSSRLHGPTNQIDLTSGDSVIMKCDNFVNHWHKNSDGSGNEVVVFMIYPDVLRSIYDGQLPDAFEVKSKPDNTLLKLGPNDMVSSFVQSLAYYFDHPLLMEDEMIKMKVKELIHLLLHTEYGKEVKSIFGSIFKSTENDFKDIIHSNLYQQLSLEELAFICKMSQSTFQRKFKEVFEMTPGAFFKSKRLEKARSLMQQTQLRISEIALECGFDDPSNFTKAFQSVYKITPSAYKDSL